jgi:flagellar M-ring protein FliF
MGYNKERGDTLNVVNSPFTGLEKETIPEPAFWQQPATIQLAKEAGKTLLIASLIGWLYFTQLKPLLRKTRPATATPAVGEPAVTEGLDSVAGTTAGGAAEPAYRNDLDHARQMARDDPKVIANVVKSWVGANE